MQWPLCSCQILPVKWQPSSPSTVLLFLHAVNRHSDIHNRFSINKHSTDLGKCLCVWPTCCTIPLGDIILLVVPIGDPLHLAVLLSVRLPCITVLNNVILIVMISLQVMIAMYRLVTGCHYFLPGPQFLSQPQGITAVWLVNKLNHIVTEAWGPTFRIGVNVPCSTIFRQNNLNDPKNNMLQYFSDVTRQCSWTIYLGGTGVW